MRRMPRWSIFTLIVVVLALGVGASVGLGTVQRSLPEVEGRVALPGLTQPVEVLRDRYGVPHIYADNAEDLFAAQGFVQAQDRFYEMDIRRMIAAGRLSEMFGDSQLESDTYIRTLGWRRVAEAELPKLSSSTRRYLDAYASGVNAYLRGRSAPDLSLEYSLLGLQGLNYRPENWTAVDSLAWLKVMAWQLSSNFSQESELAVMSATVGARRAAELYPSYPFDGFAPIVAGGTVAKGGFNPAASPVGSAGAAAGLAPADLRRARTPLATAARMDDVLSDVLHSPRAGGETGSNSWAVAGTRTASGKPIMSNDPHLETSIPSTFAQVGLHCRRVDQSCPFEVSGFSLAGVPGVTIGKNSAITWGLTTAYVDTLDLYLEDVRDDTVRVGAGYVPLQVRTEEIRVRGEDAPRKVTIRSSRHGPLLSDVDSQLREVGATNPAAQRYAVALSWMASRPGRTMDALFAINRAINFSQFRAAAAQLDAPVQNLTYADTAGNIGYQLPGQIPLRGKGNGRTPVPGWDRAYDWRGVIPFADLPYVFNPPEGFIVTANQPIIGPQYPHRLTADSSYGWRSQQLRDRLEDAGPLTMDSAEQLFYDDTMRFAAELVPSLLKVKVSDPWVLEGQRTLVGWDYSAAADSAAAAYFAVTVHNVLKLTFRDEMPETYWPAGGDRWFAVLTTLAQQPRNPWWDDITTADKVETRDDIFVAALTQARKEATSLMARDTDQWQWGKIHFATLKNTTLGTSGVGVVERLFNRGRYPMPGGSAVVNAMGYNDLEGYAVTTGPTMRMLIDLGGLDRSRWVNQTGASGHAFSTHYDDQTELWATNRMWSFATDRGAVEAAATDRLELAPGG